MDIKKDLKKDLKEAIKPIMLGKREKDERINTSIISFPMFLSIFTIIYLLTVGQAIILGQWLGESPSLIGVLTYYIIVTGLIITLLLGISKKFFYGKPLEFIAKAAREIAKGDFSVRVMPFRKDGKKDEIEVLVEDFNKMAEELSSVEMFKSNFISNVSHEIKSPLSVIQSYTKALKDHDLTDKQRDEYADTIISATTRLSDMVGNILKLSKLENQEIYPTPQSYQLGEQLRQCALNYVDLWQRKNIDFKIDVQDVVVNYDASLLEIVWNNLISNAIKFTGNGGRISITSRLNGEYIYVAVEDSGCGIDKETKARIFDKFYQGDTSRSVEGNGLGLSLVKKVIEVVRGSISVDSVIGKGSIFTVRLKV